MILNMVFVMTKDFMRKKPIFMIMVMKFISHQCTVPSLFPWQFKNGWYDEMLAWHLYLCFLAISIFLLGVFSYTQIHQILDLILQANNLQLIGAFLLITMGSFLSFLIFIAIYYKFMYYNVKLYQSIKNI